VITGPTDIGHSVVITPVLDREGRIMVNEEHDRADGKGRCGGFVMLDVPESEPFRAGGPLWTVESTDPLTLSPSLLCRACGNHGWIRNGTWVPA
jgi:hypothetical protein